eukprot:TRINITY_DN4004_c0_g1_i1.p1 TRINITY_DN4004_c0_g1~~TRINITY_DN4004_c0_g1_i1.p1  ORF type:complete len:939 (+),score=201.26 TRINITY_DN4004_c0_g1_i1:412-2817(+)
MRVQDHTLLREIVRSAVNTVPTEELAVTVWAAATLRLSPQSNVGSGLDNIMADAVAHYAQRQNALPDQELRCFAWGLAGLGYKGRADAIVSQLVRIVQSHKDSLRLAELASCIASVSVLGKAEHVGAMLSCASPAAVADMPHEDALSASVILACLRAGVEIPEGLAPHLLHAEGQRDRCIASLVYLSSKSDSLLRLPLMRRLLTTDFASLSGSQANLLLGAISNNSPNMAVSYKLACKVFDTVTILHDANRIRACELPHVWLPDILAKLSQAGVEASHPAVQPLVKSLHALDFTLVRASDSTLCRLLSLCAEALPKVPPYEHDAFFSLAEKVSQVLTMRTSVQGTSLTVALRSLFALKFLGYEDLVSELVENAEKHPEGLLALLNGAIKDSLPQKVALEGLRDTDVINRINAKTAHKILHAMTRLGLKDADVATSLSKRYLKQKKPESTQAEAASMLHMMASLRCDTSTTNDAAKRAVSIHADVDLTPEQACKLAQALAFSRTQDASLFTSAIHMIEKSLVLEKATTWDLLHIAEVFANTGQSAHPFVLKVLHALDATDISTWGPAAIEKLFSVVSRLGSQLKLQPHFRDKVRTYLPSLEDNVSHFTVRGLSCAAHVAALLKIGNTRNLQKTLLQLTELGPNIDPPAAAKLCSGMLNLGVNNKAILNEVQELLCNAPHGTSFAVLLLAMKRFRIAPHEKTLKAALLCAANEDVPPWVVRDIAIISVVNRSRIGDPESIFRVLDRMCDLLAAKEVELNQMHCMDLTAAISQSRGNALLHPRLMAELRRHVSAVQEGPHPQQR